MLGCMWAMSKFELTLASFACEASHGMFEQFVHWVETATVTSSYKPPFIIYKFGIDSFERDL